MFFNIGPVELIVALILMGGIAYGIFKLIQRSFQKSEESNDKI